MVINAGLGKVFCKLQRSLIALLFLLWMLFKWSSKVNLESRITPRCFRNVFKITAIFLEMIGEWFTFFVFLLKLTCWAWLLGSRIKLIFHGKAQFLITEKLSINSVPEVFLPWITENSDVSSAHILALEERAFDKSSMSQVNGPKIESWETHAVRFFQEEVCSFNTTLCFLSV